MYDSPKPTVVHSSDYIYSDTVNISSRMESNSKANRIHCSKAAAKLLHMQCPHMPLVSRGEISIKGKGAMHTYWVNESSVTETAVERSELSASFKLSPGLEGIIQEGSQELLLDVEAPPPECSLDDSFEGKLKERLSRGRVEV